MIGYTRPERSAEVHHARLQRERIYRAGGCRYCRHRATWTETIGERVACGLARPLVFPGCLLADPGFRLDKDALERSA